jgi:hypothetical protein
MRSAFMLTLTTWLVGAAMVFAQSPADEPATTGEPSAGSVDESADASPAPLPGPVDRSQIPALIGDILRQVSAARGSSPHRPHQHRSHRSPQNQLATPEDAEPIVQASGSDDSSVVEVPPPAPAEDLTEPQPVPQRRATPAPQPSVTDAPPAPVAGGPYSFRDRLLARRLGRVAQMKQEAAESGDEQRMQQAEYLEGMVIELHKQGLFNFAQKFLSTLQEQRSNESAADAPPAEIPEADLGEAAPLPGTELGEPAPLPDANAEPLPDAPPGNE